MIRRFDPLAFLGADTASRGVVRFGDGEWLSVLGRKGKNRDKCDYSLSRDYLRRLLAAAPRALTFGMQPYAWRTMSATVSRWLGIHAHERLHNLDGWVNADFMVELAREDRLHEFTAALRAAGRPVIWIGGPHLRGLADVPRRDFVEVPARNAVPDEVFDRVPLVTGGTYLVSAGFAAKELVARIVDHGREVIAIDTGSVWDPHVGKGSRNIWKSMLQDGKLPRLT